MKRAAVESGPADAEANRDRRSVRCRRGSRQPRVRPVGSSSSACTVQWIAWCRAGTTSTRTRISLRGRNDQTYIPALTGKRCSRRRGTQAIATVSRLSFRGFLQRRLPPTRQRLRLATAAYGWTTGDTPQGPAPTGSHSPLPRNARAAGGSRQSPSGCDGTRRQARLDCRKVFPSSTWMWLTGKFRGRDAERVATEADLMSAQREGRIQVNPRTATTLTGH